MCPSNDQKTDSEYKRNGICHIFAFVELLGGRNRAGINEHHTTINWAQKIINEYNPKNAEDMQDALKDIFDPMFETMLLGKWMRILVMSQTAMSQKVQQTGAMDTQKRL